MWLDLAIAMSCGGGGIACGWVMHALGGFGNDTLVRQAAATITKETASSEPNQERVLEVANRLKAYASSMAANVDAHQTKVQAVNNSLLEGNDSSPEAVFAAVSKLIEANQQMQGQLREAQDRIHEQTIQIETAERRAQTDALTRVPNRGAFDHHLSKRHKLGPDRTTALALIDVDHFKKFNDVYGHRAGDEVLKVVANVLHVRLQSFGLVARYGGEEFAVILDDCSLNEAAQFVESARVAIGQRDIQFEDKCLRVHASMGIAERVPGESIEQWLQRADDALYRSKEAGRNCGHHIVGGEAIRIELTSQADAPSSVSSGVASEHSPIRSNEAGTARNNGASGNGESTSAAQGPKGVMESQVQPNPGAFASLPDQQKLGAEFEEVRTRTHASVAIFVMAIRFTSPPTQAMTRSLLKIVRATMRTVDRLGYRDDSTILICMPSVDATTALSRGKQICRSVSAVVQATGNSTGRSVTVGVTQAESQEDFSQVVSRAGVLAEQCHEQNQDCLCSEAEQATV